MSLDDAVRWTAIRSKVRRGDPLSLWEREAFAQEIVAEFGKKGGGEDWWDLAPEDVISTAALILREAAGGH
jgi:hypothetical protein